MQYLVKATAMRDGSLLTIIAVILHKLLESASIDWAWGGALFVLAFLLVCWYFGRRSRFHAVFSVD